MQLSFAFYCLFYHLLANLPLKSTASAKKVRILPDIARRRVLHTCNFSCAHGMRDASITLCETGCLDPDKDGRKKDRPKPLGGLATLLRCWNYICTVPSLLYWAWDSKGASSMQSCWQIMLAIVISEKSTGAVWVGSYMCDEELMEKSHFEPSCSQILHLPLNLLKESRHSAWNYKVLSLSAGTPLTPSTKRFQSWAKWRSTPVAPASQLRLPQVQASIFCTLNGLGMLGGSWLLGQVFLQLGIHRLYTWNPEHLIKILDGCWWAQAQTPCNILCGSSFHKCRPHARHLKKIPPEKKKKTLGFTPYMLRPNTQETWESWGKTLRDCWELIRLLLRLQ